jgi:hypothetical protein
MAELVPGGDQGRKRPAREVLAEAETVGAAAFGPLTTVAEEFGLPQEGFLHRIMITAPGSLLEWRRTSPGFGC